MADVRVFKFDVDSPTDDAVKRVQKRLDASNGGEAVRRGLAIADAVTRLAKDEGKKLFVQNDDGTYQQLIIS
jgi:hypothetical protein